MTLGSRPSRATNAPNALTTTEERRVSRKLSRQQSRASSSSLDRRLSHSSSRGFLVTAEPAPSPTTLRLKSLARAIRASQTLGTLRVRKKYALQANEFSTEEMNMEIDMMAMIEDTSSVGTAPWASSNSNNARQGTLQPQQVSLPETSKSKARWKSAGKAVQQLAANSGTTSPNQSPSLSLSPTKAPGLRRTNNDGRGGSRPATVKRVGSIRGDLNMLLNNAPFDPQQTQTSLNPLHNTELPHNLDARIFCACSLYKLSCQVGSELPIIKGGAINQIADFSDIENLKLLRYCAATLANLTTDANALNAFVEFDGIQALLELSWSPCLHVKILKLYGSIAEERLRNITVPCSRALANFSSNEDLRKNAFLQEIVHMTTRLTLLDRQRFVSSPEDSRVFYRNIVRTLCNLSFNDMCTAYFMELPQVLPLLHAIAISVDESQTVPAAEGAAASPSRVNLFADEDAKEDALVTILNLAQQAAYSSDLVRILDGKRLAIAAQDPNNSGHLKYVYSLVLCNLLFESRLQQIVYGDQVILSLIYGFYFFGLTETHDDVNAVGNAEQVRYKNLKLAFGDDQERFLVAICIMASEIMDAHNIERIIALILDCLQRPIASMEAPTANKEDECSSNNGQQSQHVGGRLRATQQRRCTRLRDRLCEEEIRTAFFAGGKEAAPVSVEYCGTAQTFCAATLYHICASGHVNQRIIQALIHCCNANEETLSLLACAASFAIVSFTVDGRHQLIACDHLAKALNRLGWTSQPESQQHAAIAACNVSTLKCIWTSTELKDFIVMALLRANSVQAKQIHAKTLSNLLSHLSTREKVVEDGVLYVLTKLSQVMLYRSASAPYSGHSGSSTPITSTRVQNDPSTPRHLQEAVRTHSSANSVDEMFSIGLQALFNLSCEHQYHHRLLNNGVIPYLAAAVDGKQASAATGASTGTSTPTLQTHTHLLTASSFSFTHSNLAQSQCSLSVDSRRYAMGISCNLSSYEENHKELMNAQVTDIIRNFTQCEHQIVKQFAVEALANCSLITDSLHLYGELRVPRAVLALLECVSKTTSDEADDNDGGGGDDGDPNMEICMAALKCLHNIALNDALALNLLEESSIVRILPLLERPSLGHDAHACLLVATMAHILAGEPKCGEALLHQRVVSLCAHLHRQHPHNKHIAYECVGILMKLSTYQQIQEKLTETQAIHVVVSICSSPTTGADLRIRECGAITIRNLTLSVTEHLSLFYGDAGLEGAEGVGLEAKQMGQANDHVEQRDLWDELHAARGGKSDDTKVSRLTERHLLHGVKYFQQELDSLHDAENASPHHAAVPVSDRILHEACAGIANLSTIKAFRVMMVRLGIMNTLLRVYEHGPRSHAHAHARSSLLKSICAATLHRLAVEEEATIGDNGLLVPSLLSILRLNDEELHHVRYECEKVSLFSPNSPSRRRRQARFQTVTTEERGGSLNWWTSVEGRDLSAIGRGMGSSCAVDKTLNRRGSIVVVGGMGSPAAGLTHIAMAATTNCVKQSYREQKWMFFVLKTTLSSASMIPQLEKKHMHTIGIPRLSFQDIMSAAAACNNAENFSTGLHSTTSSAVKAASSVFGSTASLLINSTDVDAGFNPGCAAKPKGGYLLSVNRDKYMIHHDEHTGQPTLTLMHVDENGVSTAENDSVTWCPTSARSLITDVPISIHPQRATPDWEVIMHSRKFDRHMRITRRNHRRNPNSLPVLSMLS